MPRRDFLRRSAYTVAGATLFSCTGGRVIPKLDDPTPAIDTRTPIKRVVYVMLENRSFNNLFGAFPGVRGTTVGADLGKEKPLMRCPDWLPGDLPHDRVAAISSINAGAMDGFGLGIYGSTYAYAQFDPDQVPNYWLWAKEYALSDNFFASANGPRYPNHFFFVAGTSGGVIDNPENIGVRWLEDGSKFKSWGCDAVGDDVFVFTKDDNGNLAKHDTCFGFETVGEQLTGIGIDWAYYAPTPGQAAYFWNAYNGVANVIHTDLWHEHIRPVDDVVRHIEADGLTWDEWGGFYDPVAPPQLDHVGLGMRVPLLTISPYSRRGVIDTELGEFSAPLRFIADNWLPYLTPRIENALAFEHVFDFSAKPRPPVLGSKRAPAYGEPFEWPGDTYRGWEPGTVPVEDPL